MTAHIVAAIDGYSWTAQDQANLELVLDGTDSVSKLVRHIDGSLAYDTLVAAGARVWGSGVQTMRLLQGDRREVEVVALGHRDGATGAFAICHGPNYDADGNSRAH